MWRRGSVRAIACTMNCSRCVLLTVVAVAIASPARAESDRDRQLRSLVAAQVAAINAHDPKAFAATFDADRGFAILPAAADEGEGSAAITVAAKHWLTALGSATVKLDQPHYGSSWFDAQLVVSTGARLRITGVTISQQPDGDKIKLGAVHISEPVEDKVVMASIDKLPALPKLGDGGDRSSIDGPDKIATFANRMFDTQMDGAPDPGDVVIGSAPSEHAIGKVAAGKLLASWKSLKMTSVAVVRTKDPDDMLIVWFVAHVNATTTNHGKSVTIPYRVLTIVMEPWAAAADRGAKSSLVSAHFSVATH